MNGSSRTFALLGFIVIIDAEGSANWSIGRKAQSATWRTYPGFGSETGPIQTLGYQQWLDQIFRRAGADQSGALQGGFAVRRPT